MDLGKEEDEAGEWNGDSDEDGGGDERWGSEEVV